MSIIGEGIECLVTKSLHTLSLIFGCFYDTILSLIARGDVVKT